MTRRHRSIVVWSLAVLFVAASGLPAVRTTILRMGGWALVLDEPLESVDVVVVVLGGDRAPILEAADYVHAGITSRVAVLSDPPDKVERELTRRGVAFEDETAAAIRLLNSLGVSAVERIPKAGSGTEQIGPALPRWCDARGYRKIVVVSPPDHSRRMRRMLDRSLTGHETKARVRIARHSSFEPDHWWQDRDGQRTGIVELQKLLLDYVRHPFS
jgi:hypothetical protein